MKYIRGLLNKIKQFLKWFADTIAILYYSKTTKPWTFGYLAYRWRVIHQTLEDSSMMRSFVKNQNFDPYGFSLDERVAEYPWVFSRLQNKPLKLLDAGSALNFYPLIQRLKKMNYHTSILTLAPEPHCFWKDGVSYHFGDLRELPFRSEWFDTIVCISTLEHVGMDNQNYGSQDGKEIDDKSFLQAVKELSRVLKPDGQFLITVPYGQRDYIRWGNSTFARQFDKDLLEELTNVLEMEFTVSFFKYTNSGWERSSQAECEEVHYFNIHESKYDPDYAAAARAIACVEAIKRPKSTVDD